MVRRRKGGYGGRFATRRAARRRLLVLTGVLLLEIAAVIVAQRWVTYTDEGVRFQPPFLSRTSASVPRVDVNIQVRAADPAGPSQGAVP